MICWNQTRHCQCTRVNVQVKLVLNERSIPNVYHIASAWLVKIKWTLCYYSRLVDVRSSKWITPLNGLQTKCSGIYGFHTINSTNILSVTRQHGPHLHPNQEGNNDYQVSYGEALHVRTHCSGTILSATSTGQSHPTKDNLFMEQNSQLWFSVKWNSLYVVKTKLVETRGVGMALCYEYNSRVCGKPLVGLGAAQLPINRASQHPWTPISEGLSTWTPFVCTQSGDCAYPERDGSADSAMHTSREAGFYESQASFFPRRWDHLQTWSTDHLHAEIDDSNDSTKRASGEARIHTKQDGYYTFFKCMLMRLQYMITATATCWCTLGHR